jgi:hypothetical protein
MKKLLLSSVISLVCAANSGAHIPSNPEEVVELPISKKGMTRITIDNDGIEDIFAFPMEFADNITHHKGGHIFVVADDLKGPLYVTVITTRGTAQDLKLIPKSKQAEPILLSFENKESHQQLVQEGAAAILESFVQGIVPAGFYSINVDEVSRTKESLEALVDKAYQNGRYRVLVFKVRNVSDEKINLDNRVLWASKDLASAFDQSQLNRGEVAQLFVIQNR